MKRFISSVVLVLVFSFVYAQDLKTASVAFENDQFRNAKSVYFSLLNSGGDNSALAYIGLIKTYVACNQIDSAKLVAQRGASIHASSAFGKVINGVVLLLDGKDEAATSAFNEAEKMASKNGTVYAAIADAWLYVGRDSKSNRYKNALEVAKRGIVADAKNYDLYIVYGDALKRDPNGGGQAASSYEKAHELKPEISKALQRLGVLFIEARNFEASSAQFEKIIAADANYAAAFRDYGELHYTFRNYELAVEKYKVYLSMADSTVDNLTRYVYMLHQAKKYAEEIPVINQLIAMDSTNNTLNRLLAYSYAEQKRDATNDSVALMYMEKFLRNVEPSKIISLDYKYYGRLLSRNGKDSLAIDQLRMGFSKDSTDLELALELADILYKARRYNESAAGYKHRIENLKNPSAIEYFNFGRACYFNKEFALADSAFLKVIELKPSVSTGYYWHAKTNMIMYPDSLDNNFLLWTTFLEKADVPETKEKIENLIDGWDYQAVYYIKKEDNAKAMALLSKILEKKPDYQRAKDLLKQLK